MFAKLIFAPFAPKTAEKRELVIMLAVWRVDVYLCERNINAETVCPCASVR